jgi:hypothetical protein
MFSFLKETACRSEFSRTAHLDITKGAVSWVIKPVAESEPGVSQDHVSCFFRVEEKVNHETSKSR